nr:LOB domain-containing protein 25 [Ipomoea batatas]
MSSSSSYSNPPCAACKFLRRKCLPGCVFAPYFPPEEPQKFANVHKIFGASNVSKLLNEIQPHQREDAVNSLAYEAEARLKDPVYGCVGAISVLQRQVLRLQKELDATNADLMRYARNEMSCGAGHGYHHPTTPDDHNNMNNYHQMYNQQRSSSNNNQYGRSSRSRKHCNSCSKSSFSNICFSKIISIIDLLKSINNCAISSPLRSSPSLDDADSSPSDDVVNDTDGLLVAVGVVPRFAARFLG